MSSDSSSWDAFRHNEVNAQRQRKRQRSQSRQQQLPTWEWTPNRFLHPHLHLSFLLHPSLSLSLYIHTHICFFCLWLLLTYVMLLCRHHCNVGLMLFWSLKYTILILHNLLRFHVMRFVLDYCHFQLCVPGVINKENNKCCLVDAVNYRRGFFCFLVVYRRGFWSEFAGIFNDTINGGFG